MKVIDDENYRMLLSYCDEHLEDRLGQPNPGALALALNWRRNVGETVPHLRNGAGNLGKSIRRSCRNTWSIEQADYEIANCGVRDFSLEIVTLHSADRRSFQASGSRKTLNEGGLANPWIAQE
jgi:hypothetical protein